MAKKKKRLLLTSLVLRAVVVAQLVERSEICGSNLVTGKFYLRPNELKVVLKRVKIKKKGQEWSPLVIIKK